MEKLSNIMFILMVGTISISVLLLIINAFIYYGLITGTASACIFVPMCISLWCIILD